MALPERRDQPRKRRRPATILEPIDELLGLSNREPTIDESPPRPASSIHSGGPHEALPSFRPALRPPMALLCAFDDGQHTGEIVRVRVPSFVIGRSEGGLIIPHDGGISGRHAEIGRRLADDRVRWYLRDLGSTNGTFVRTLRAVLLDGQEILIGGQRFRFELNPGPDAAVGDSQKHITEPGARGRPARPAVPVSDEPTVPYLVEIGPDGEESRHSLTDAETWIGRDPNHCAIVVDQPCVSPKHALIKTKRSGRWVIENARSRDGTWLRIHEIELGRGAQFQCGEQRFLIRVL
jgi:pSer/pThr/pTyr-binding forkhead associated (FHA) protein